MKIDDNFYMKLAIDEAWKYQLLTYPNPAVGCVIVKDGKLLSIEAHKEAGMPHAEVNALKAAYLLEYPNSILKMKNSSQDIHTFLLENHNGYFNDCEIFVTLEPCNHIGKTPSCANLLKELKPKKALNKAFLKVKPNRIEIEKFKANLIALIDQTNDLESEEFHKNFENGVYKNEAEESLSYVRSPRIG